jgi:DNA-binding MarR family transcriptional regulator/GNAT superfamily N-acetyltransferase
MQKGLAGTDLSPSAVHTIIELGYGTVKNASELGKLLHLEKSSISRLLHKLEREGLIAVQVDKKDKRARVLSLTPEGTTLLQEVEAFARNQLADALGQLPAHSVDEIETGLAGFAKALSSGTTLPPDTPNVEIETGYRAGLIGTVARMHAEYYAKNYGFGPVFERKVATEMAEFIGRIENPSNTTIRAVSNGTLVGSVSLDGEDLGHGECHLRWFIVDQKAHGMGVGNLLMTHATAFADANDFARTRLWTFKGLDAARHLYEKHGFALVHEVPGTQWGTEVIEQEFVREAG